MVNPNNFSPPGSGLVWFGLPKTASSSQKKAVGLSFGLLGDHEIKSKGAGLPLKVINDRLDIYTLPEVHALQQRESGIISFCTIRNPFDRVVSLWNERIRGRERGTIKRRMPGGLSLEEFAEWLGRHPDDADLDHHCHRMVTKTVIDGVFIPRVVMRFERLIEDWRDCQRTGSERCGVALRDLDHLRNGRRVNHYREMYTPRARRLVAERYAEDLERFNYEF